MLIFRNFFLGLTFAVLCSPGAWAQGYTITTFAGNNGLGAGYTGDAGAATAAQLNGPSGLAIDSSGNIYIADSLNNVVRVVSPTGTISTFAGNNTAGYTGDKGAATSAELHSPVGLAIDSSSNVYIADSINNVIRKVAGGTITTIAGNNTQGYVGDLGSATSAELWAPTALALDSSGNLYFADSDNNVIREVLASNQYIYSLSLDGAGNPGQQLQHPTGVAIGASGTLYITDTDNRRVVEYSNGVYTTLAGNYEAGSIGDNGPAINAEVNDPVGVLRDSAGNIYFADTNNYRIRRISPDGVITTIAGNGHPGYYGDNGPATSAELNSPKYLLMDSSGKIYVSDAENNVVRVLTPPPAPSITANGIGNAASYVTQLAPGGLGTIYGANLSIGTVSGIVNASTPLATMLNGVTVTVNGVAAPVLYVSPTIVNFQVPYETAVGPATVIVSVGGVASNSATIPVDAALPGIFVLPSGGPTVENYPQYSLNTPQNPAPAGSFIIVYVTGLGTVSPAVADGAVAPSNTVSWAVASYSATIGSADAPVSFAGLTPGSFGLGQMNVQVPSSGLAPGNYPLVVTVNGQASNPVTISVH